jgi:hypothetical protein
VRGVDHTADQRLVAAVDAVEVPNGHHRAPIGLRIALGSGDGGGRVQGIKLRGSGPNATRRDQLWRVAEGR